MWLVSLHLLYLLLLLLLIVVVHGGGLDHGTLTATDAISKAIVHIGVISYKGRQKGLGMG